MSGREPEDVSSDKGIDAGDEPRGTVVRSRFPFVIVVAVAILGILVLSALIEPSPRSAVPGTALSIASGLSQTTVTSVPASASVQASGVVTSAVHVENGTSLPVSVLINGNPAEVVLPQTTKTIDAARISRPPWRVEARTSGGRVLGTVLIAAPTVNYDLRLDLSCGRLEIWLGGPLGGGPSPDVSPGTSGDCAP